MKKRPVAAVPPAPPAPPMAPRAPAAPVVDTEAWTARVQAAAADDAALLDLAVKAPTAALKLAAVSAIQGEATLKRAVRELRDADKRVFREAKRRHEAQVAQREAREQAAKLIAAATALAAAETIAANRLVELERAWAAVDAGLLEPETRDEFARLSAQLSTLVRERGERQQALERWNAAATVLLQGLAAVLDAPDAEALRASAGGIEAHLAASPEGTPDERRQALADALAAARRAADAIDARVAAEGAAAEAAASAAAVAPPDGNPAEAAAVLAAADDAEARRARQAERAAGRKEAADALAAALDQAEAALAEGHLADALKRLDAREIAGWAERVEGPLKARLHAVQAEAARLKGWQHWGGGRAREDLVAEAEALAQQLVPIEGAPPVKLALKPHAAAIDSLRRRWKEIDRTGGASSQPLWLRFDAALTAAYVPVAAQVAEQKAQREQNLAQRQQLLDALEAVAVEGDPADWKALARTLDQFQADWRKLGPAEHTVPHAARDALRARERAAVERLEAPLQGARRVAQAGREDLVARAEAIAAEAAAGGARDTILRVRDLQGAWQQHAKSLPLARGVESALWARFKAATDAVFAERDAAAQARDAQFAQQAAEREALIERLNALTVDTPPAEVKRTLAEVEREWRHAPAPRHAAGGLDARFGAALDAARGLLHSRAEREWQAACEALSARVGLCHAFEDALPAPAAERRAQLEADWSAAPVVAPAWDAALKRRWGGLQAAADGAPSGNADDLDATLLRLESALELPSPPDWQAARRDLKLQAMKAALEGRHAGRAAPDAATLLADALASSPSTPPQRERLGAVLVALRARRGL